ncbi:MAG: ribosomal protein S18-alanine N-acetyltransferase [Gracilibacteraceae bacterium]|jgi:ribosomal-protein-alanine N-acetyltransferase|nr:ribosomal protein S18-alanine N-acetyltransferase [Gracilibacteraceae bacterium]
MSEVRVRPAEPRDVPAVAALETANFSRPWSLESLKADITKNKLARYFCLEADGQVRGYIGVWLIFDEAHITNIAIREDCRRQGWGEFLLRSVIAELIPAGISKMTLEVRRSNTAAQALYQKLGFVAEGLRPRYYEDDREDAVVMWAVLV